MGYIHVIFFLFLCERIQYRILGRACMYTGALDALYRKSPCKHERPSCSRCPRTRRYRAQPPRTYCQSRVIRLSISRLPKIDDVIWSRWLTSFLPCRCVWKSRHRLSPNSPPRSVLKKYRYLPIIEISIRFEVCLITPVSRPSAYVRWNTGVMAG